MTNKPKSGERFPDITVPQLDGGELRLGAPIGDRDWQMVVVYRGKHCPICKTYLAELERVAPAFAKAGVSVVAVSSDPEDRARSFIDDIGVSFPVGYNLTVDQMRTLGLYVSEPRSEKETDRPFAEPGVFVVNADGHASGRGHIERAVRKTGSRWPRQGAEVYPRQRLSNSWPSGLKRR